MTTRHPFFDTERPMVLAHRGGGALAPENTLAAFDQAVAMDVDGIELDLHLSSDGRLVVCHDPTVDRTTDGSGCIADMPLAALRELDAGHAFTPDGGKTFPFRGRGVCIPTFEEVLARYGGSTRFSVELKLGDLLSTRKAAECAASGGVLRRICLGAFTQRPVSWLRAERPLVATYATRREVIRFLLRDGVRLSRLAAPRADAFCIPEYTGRRRIVTPRLVASLARHRTPLHVWTVNEEADMQRLLSWGVGGLVTDRPDLALALVGS